MPGLRHPPSRLLGPVLSTVLLSSLTLLAPPAAKAQTVEKEQVWLNLTVMGAMGEDGVYFVEAQPRIGDGARLEPLLLRAAVGWKLSPDVAFYQGYGRIITQVDQGPNLAEDRSFQQLSWTIARPQRGEISSRTRLEQRWRSDGSGTAWRLREMIRAERQVAPSGLAALAYAEVFVGLNDTEWGARSGFDQLRSFVGAEVPAGGQSTIEVGYLNHWVHQGRGRDRVNHVASIALFLRP